MRFIAALLLALLLAPHPAKAQVLDAKAQADVRAVEAYLNGIKTMKSKFIQTTGDGKRASGEFMLRRPGRMRFTYDAPLKDFIVADGIFVHYYDGAMKQGSRTLISRSLADFFLRDNLTLAGDLQVSKVERDPVNNMLMVTLTEAKDQSAGSLILGLTEQPQLALSKWRIVDAQGAITEVELVDMSTGMKLDKNLFHYYDPEHTSPRYN